MRATDTRGGAARPETSSGLWRTGPAGRIGPDGVRYDVLSSPSGVAWLTLAVVGMIVTFAFGLWLAHWAHSVPRSPYDVEAPPAVSSPPEAGGTSS